MAVDILNLGFKVDTADVKNASKDLDNLGSSAKKAGSSLGGMSDDAKKVSKETTALSGSIATLAKAYLTIEGVKAFANISDEQVKYTAQLKIATSSADEFNQALEKSQNIAKIAQTSIASVAMVYARFSNALKDSSVSQKQVGLIAENVALALKVSGAGAGETASAMLQLSQAFASGTLRGDEFNSMAENAPNLMRALAASMKVPVGELRAMAAEGKITSTELLKAFSDPQLNQVLLDQAKNINTISGSWTNFWEQIKLVIADLGQQSMITDMLTASLNGLTAAMENARKFFPKEPTRDAEQQRALDEKNLEYLRKKGALGIREEERLKRVAELEKKLGVPSYGSRIGGERAITPQTAPMPNFGATVAVVDTEKLHKQQEEAKRKAEQAAKNAKEVEKANRELLTSIRELTEGERSNIQVLQDKLDHDDKITASTKRIGQANLDLARSLEVQTAFQEAFNRGLENEADILNRAIEETDAYAKAQSDAYTNIYQDLEKENEDLNAKLIINDKERGLKQLELEHQRKVAVIQNTIEIGAAQDDALRREDENYQKRIELLGKTQDGFMELKNAIEGFSRDASRALVDFAFGAEMTFSNMVTSMLKELSRLVIQRSIMDPIVNSISGAIGDGGFGGLLGSAPMAAGGTGSGFMGWLSGILPARATGGDVMANSPYIVGEKGKELFIPKTAGTIVPSSGVGGGTQVNNVSISITESGAKTEQGDSTKLAKQLEAAVVKVLIDQKRQGGVYA